MVPLDVDVPRDAITAGSPAPDASPQEPPDASPQGRSCSSSPQRLPLVAPQHTVITGHRCQRVPQRRRALERAATLVQRALNGSARVASVVVWVVVVRSRFCVCSNCSTSTGSAATTCAARHGDGDGGVIGFLRSPGLAHGRRRVHRSAPPTAPPSTMSVFLPSFLAACQVRALLVVDEERKHLAGR